MRNRGGQEMSRLFVTSQRRRRQAFSYLTMITAGVGCPTIAQAQVSRPATDAASPVSDQGQVPDIVVTAERRSARLQDVPVAVSAFDAVALERRGATSLQDVSARVPSLEIHSTSRPGGGGSSIAAYIRGVGTGDYNIPTDPAIGIYVDGVYLARSVGGLLSLTDIQQIQILNGPLGLLYGRNTLGGAILVTTRKPKLSGGTDGQVGARLGNFTRRDVQAGMQIALADDLTAVLSGDYTRQRQHPPVVAATSLTAPPARLAQYNSLVAPSVDSQLGLPVGTVLDSRWLSTDYRTSYSTAPIRDASDIGGVSLRLNYAPSAAIELNAITAYRALSANILVSSDGTPYNVFVGGSDFHDHQVSSE